MYFVFFATRNIILTTRGACSIWSIGISLPQRTAAFPTRKRVFGAGRTFFWRTYGRCAICGELIRPPKLWYWYRNGLFLLPAAAYFPILIWLLNLAVRTDGPAYLAFVLLLLTCLSLFAISELIERAILTFGRWQEFPTGLKAKQLQFRSDRKSQKRIFIWFGISLSFYFVYFALICFFRR